MHCCLCVQRLNRLRIFFACTNIGSFSASVQPHPVGSLCAPDPRGRLITLAEMTELLRLKAKLGTRLDTALEQLLGTAQFGKDCLCMQL